MVRRRARAERPTHPTKQALIDTTLRLLETTPVEQLTCDEVLNASGISRGSLYHHFDDYPDLVEHALAVRFASQVDASITAIAGLLHNATGRDDLLARLAELSRLTQRRDRMEHRTQRVVAFAGASHSPRFRAVLAEQQQRLTDAQAELVEHAQELGWIRKELDPQVVAVFVQAYTLGRIVDDFSVEPMDEEGWNRLIIDVLERVLFTER